MQEKYKGVYVFEPTGKYEGSRDVLEMLAELRAKRSEENGTDNRIGVRTFS